MRCWPFSKWCNYRCQPPLRQVDKTYQVVSEIRKIITSIWKPFEVNLCVQIMDFQVQVTKKVRFDIGNDQEDQERILKEESKRFI